MTATLEKRQTPAGGPGASGKVVSSPDTQNMPEAVPFVQQIQQAAAFFTLQGEEAQPVPQPPAPRFRLLSADDVTNTPPMQWTLKGILPRRGVGQAYGASMSGKSFLLLNMAAHIAEGKDWHDFRVKQTPVVYVALEGEEGFRQRIRALLHWRGRPLSPDLHFVMQPFAINTAADVAALSPCIPKGALVIIDTQNASCPLVDENSAKDIGGIIEGAKNLARAIDGFVLLVAHTGKEPGRGPRGSSAQIPAWDACIEVVRNGQHREWITRKVKDGQDGQRFPFRLAVIDLGEDEDGDRITSCVALPDDDPAKKDEKPLSGSQKYALATLEQCLAEAKSDSVSLDAWRSLYNEGSTLDNEKSKAAVFSRARKELVELGVISVSNNQYGKATKTTVGNIVATRYPAKTSATGNTTQHPSLEGVECCHVDGGGRTMNDLLAFIPALKQKSPIEWAGPCPRCGGDDRFIVWPEREKGGAFLCRGCAAQGDGIAFLMQFHGMSYREACEALHMEPSQLRTVITSTTPKSKPAPVSTMPPADWQQQAAAFLHSCQVGLETNPAAVVALAARGLTPDTARTCGIGWNDRDRYELRADWGLPLLPGKEKLLLPRGVVISTRRSAGTMALTVRCPDDRPKGRPRYWQVIGGASVPFIGGEAGLPVVLLESALDACLLWQEAGGLCAAVAFMGNMKGMDAETDAFIKTAPVILAAPDNDPGGQSAWQRWSAAYPRATCCPAIGAKDIGDMHRAALSLDPAIPTCREWAEAALTLARKTAPDCHESAVFENSGTAHAPAEKERRRAA